MTPIGTKITTPASLLEQRTHDTYHQRYPWPDKDAQRVQNALLDAPTPGARWLFALTCLIAATSGLLLVRGCT